MGDGGGGGEKREKKKGWGGVGDVEEIMGDV